MVEISHNSIAIAGEFAVLSQLALRGFDANTHDMRNERRLLQKQAAGFSEGG